MCIYVHRQLLSYFVCVYQLYLLRHLWTCGRWQSGQVARPICTSYPGAVSEIIDQMIKYFGSQEGSVGIQISEQSMLSKATLFLYIDIHISILLTILIYVYIYTYIYIYIVFLMIYSNYFWLPVWWIAYLRPNSQSHFGRTSLSIFGCIQYAFKPG